MGGLVLGPTLLGRIWPEAYDWLFPPDGVTHDVLMAVYQLGLLLLMFTAGTQMKGLVHRGSARAVAAISVAGLLVPFAAGLALFAAVDLSRYEGAAQDHTALALVFSIAIAVTSIPIISRIMLDLGLLQTRFARIVLTVAVIEDIVLYVVLAVAIGLVVDARHRPLRAGRRARPRAGHGGQRRLPHHRRRRACSAWRWPSARWPTRGCWRRARTWSSSAEPDRVPAGGHADPQRGLPAARHRAAVRRLPGGHHRRHGARASATRTPARS